MSIGILHFISCYLSVNYCHKRGYVNSGTWHCCAEAVSYTHLDVYKRQLASFDEVLGLNLLSAAEKARSARPEEEHDPEIDALVAARTEAKRAKNWPEADRIRDELKARGIEVIDTPQGAKWKRI